MKASLIILLVLLCSLRAKDDLSELYSIDKNKILYLNDEFRDLIEKVKIEADSTNFSFFHIGDSHVQIGVFPDGVMDQLKKSNIRTDLGWTTPNRGRASYIGRDFKWEIKGSTDIEALNSAKDKSKIGCTGRSMFILDKKSKLTLYAIGEQKISAIRIFSEINSGLQLKSKRNKQSKALFDQGLDICTIGDNSAHKKRFKVRFTNNSDKAIPIYGIDINPNWVGVDYSNLGVSGATFLDWEKAALFEDQLHALRPQLLVITLGTNDAYKMGDNEMIFKEKVQSFVAKIRRASPQTQILLMTAPETAYKGERAPHLDFVNQSIREIAASEQIPLWDWYEIAGGKSSFETWKAHGMFDTDQLHLSPKGYEFLGKLLVEALLNSTQN